MKHIPEKLFKEQHEMLKYFLYCLEHGNMTITGLDVTKLRQLIEDGNKNLEKSKKVLDK